MTNLNAKGKLLEYKSQIVKNDDNIPHKQHIYTLLVPSGVTEVVVSDNDYIASLCALYEVADIDAFTEYVKENEIQLYWKDTEKYIGYSFTEGFVKNHFVKDMATGVLIKKCVATPTGIEFVLEDGTTAKRSFSKQIGGKDGKWYPDLQKQMRFIKNLVGLERNPMDFATPDGLEKLQDILTGSTIDYVVDRKLVDSPYLDIKHVYPKTTTKETPASTVDSATDLLSSLKND